MPYIGKSPVAGGFHKLDNLTASATATYALTLGGAAYYPESANQLLVSLNGVIQAPQDSFTVSGSNIVFDSALTASDSIDFIVALGDVIGVGSVTDGAITTAKLGNGAVTDAKIDTMAASKLTGALPAIDGSALTGIGGMTLLSTNSISGASTSVSVAASGYNYLMLHIYGLDAAAGYEASVRFNSDSGSNYKWARLTQDANSSPSAGGGTTTSFHLGQTGAAGFTNGNTNNNAIMRVYFPNGTSHWKSTEWSSIQDTGTDDVQNFQSGHWRDNSAITSVQVVCTSSTFTSGTINIYGVK
jgi:hypothetical protein